MYVHREKATGYSGGLRFIQRQLDIRLIQLSRSKEEFEAACAVTFMLWKVDARLFAFAEYFEQEWGPESECCGWYEGFSMRQPSSNNEIRWFKELDDNPDEVPALTKRIPCLLKQVLGSIRMRLWPLNTYV